MSTNTDAQLLTIPEVAAVLRISRGRAYELAASGELPVIKVGARLRVDRESLATWIAERERGGS